MDTEGTIQSELRGSESAPVFAAGAPESRADVAPEPESPDVQALGTPPPPAPPSLWPQRLSIVASCFYEWLSRPRVRLTVTGVILLLVGGVLVTNSVWTLPLVVVGALMVATAWIGRRLDGRFAIEWGEAGTQLEFRAKIAAPPVTALETGTSFPHEMERLAPSRPAQAETIDGVAHTVEIEVAELEALIAAAETAGGEPEQPEAAVQATRNLRVAYGGGRSSDVAR